MDGGDGSELGDGAYAKQDGAHEGTVYVVAGSSGKTSPGTYTHPVMLRGIEQLGSVVLDVDGDRCDVTFLGLFGAVLDEFTLFSGDPVPTLGVTNLTAGSTAVFDVANMVPGEAVVIAWSVWGGGPIPTPFGTAFVTPPYFLLPTVFTGPTGHATLPTAVPSGTSGLRIWFQGLVVGPGGTAELTTPLDVVVQ
ncbi:MAG: hypothetical protein R3F34_18690 [Planctomycetota bacterium]